MSKLAFLSISLCQKNKYFFKKLTLPFLAFPNPTIPPTFSRSSPNLLPSFPQLFFPIKFINLKIGNV